jgi:hypothetical protein
MYRPMYNTLILTYDQAFRADICDLIGKVAIADRNIA